MGLCPVVKNDLRLVWVGEKTLCFFMDLGEVSKIFGSSGLVK